MKDKRIAILFLTIFIDLLGFGIIIPIIPNLAKTMASVSGLGINPDIAVGLVAAVFRLSNSCSRLYLERYQTELAEGPSSLGLF